MSLFWTKERNVYKAYSLYRNKISEWAKAEMQQAVQKLHMCSNVTDVVI